MNHRLRQGLVLGIALAVAPGTWLRSPEPPHNHVQALRQEPLASGVERLGPFRVAGVWHLSSDNSLFGSYSALVAPAPGRLLAFSDRGAFVSFAAPGGEAGEVRIGAVAGRTRRHKLYLDIESATRDAVTGRIYLALEGRNALARYGPDLALEALRAIPEMRRWGNNSGPEAMVRLADGRFVVLREGTIDTFGSGGHQALLFAGDPTGPGPAKAFTFAGAEGFRPTAMAALPDGRVLVLMRGVTWPMPPRFKAKLLLADPAEITPGGTWRGAELADLSSPLPLDNFEALAISADSDDALVAWLMSDNNQALSQRTLLLKLSFSLSDLPALRLDAKPARSPGPTTRN